MKRIVNVLIVALITFVSCKNEDQQKENVTGKQPLENPMPLDGDKAVADPANFTTVQWLDSMVDFGTVTSGEKVNINFRFKNTGDQPLVVQGVVPACGCTVPEYSKEPVMPGKEGFIKGVFNSVGQAPTVHKTISVSMNTKGNQNHTLTFIGEIKK